MDPSEGAREMGDPPSSSASIMRMTAIWIQTERTWHDRSDQMGVDQTERRAKPAFKTRNRAKIAHQMPEPWQAVPKRFDPCVTQRKNGREDIQLGECRLTKILDVFLTYF